MKVVERKARKILKNAYLEHLDIKNSRIHLDVYLDYRQFFEELFPDVNVDRLEIVWKNQWKKGGSC